MLSTLIKVCMKKNIVLADTHIGFSQTNHNSIDRALDVIEEEKDDIELLILNGDIVDLWRCKYEDIKTNETFIHLQEIANIIKTVYVRGNHDYVAHKIIGKDLNVDYTRMFVHNNICYIHGDRFSTFQIESFFALITKRFNFISRLIDKNIMSSNISSRFIKRIEKFKVDNFFEHVIVAHNHIPGIYKGIVFCGSAFDHMSYIEVTDEKIKIKRI